MLPSPAYFFAIQESSVDFPEPFIPKIPTASPFATDREILSSTSLLPYDLLIFSILNIIHPFKM